MFGLTTVNFFLPWSPIRTSTMVKWTPRTPLIISPSPSKLEPASIHTRTLLIIMRGNSTYFHDHWKTSLIGHSDNNGSVDPGHLRITYAYNYWKNIGSRAPSLRFGTGHVYNSFFEK